ncbi:hypothetical protein VTJ83DRAFT_1091 [Remersonia thermophila]|uniref:DRBM domain-containing protein n=1 Tax=Remersonia thermophila TaxID=72144 RepID=A0ABR4DN49_9PEZI
MAKTIDSATVTSFVDEPLIYRKLMDWLKEQEASRRPLSEVQKKAISVLLSSTPTEPSIGDSNWVGVLNSFSQVSGAVIDFRVGSVYDVGGNPRHTCVCELKLSPWSNLLSFPRQEEEEEGSPAQGRDGGAWTLPTFSRRKDAKQHAAKCAVEYLVRDGQIAFTEAGVPKFPGGKKTKAGGSGGGGIINGNSINGNSINGNSINGNSINGNSINGNSINGNSNNGNSNNGPQSPNGQADAAANKYSDELHIMKRVEELCAKMGLAVPQYRVWPTTSTTTTSSSSTTTSSTTTSESPGQQFFDARADWAPRDAIKVPRGVGCVARVYGRRNARYRVAEQVLEWLVEEETRRMREVEELMAAT